MKFRPVLLLAVLPACGCVPLQLFDASPTEGVVPLVPNGPFAGVGNVPGPVQAGYTPPAATAAMLRVDRAGREVLAANPEIGLRPSFAAVGKEHVEIFHQGTHIIYITEGLVKQCKTDAQLAAVLSLELGKMTAEQAALAPKADAGDVGPLEVPIGNIVSPGAVDLPAMAERARHENGRKKAKWRALPDPQRLAETYLTNAGHSKKELAAIGPLLAQAERNFLIEKQFNGSPSAGGWRPVSPTP